MYVGYPLSGRGRGHVTIFFNLLSLKYFSPRIQNLHTDYYLSIIRFMHTLNHSQ